jgi:cyclopropane fatty-acyl-phospholipid synthase-like methyltransferase
VSRIALARRVSARYGLRSLRGYVYWKVRSDPAYDAVRERLRGHETRPLLDLGCGVGVLGLYLRERGFDAPVLGVDFDARKIEAAIQAARGYEDLEFIRGDVRDPLPANHNVVLLDILQYVTPDDQRRVLENVAAAVPPGGVAVIRQGVRDDSWRHKVTLVVDAFGRAARWMQAERLNPPTAEEISRPFAAAFEAEITPLWGRSPFNNYLFVFRRREVARRPE